MVDLTSLTVKRDLLDLARTTSSLILKFIGITSMEAILLLTCVYVFLQGYIPQLYCHYWVVRQGEFLLGYCLCVQTLTEDEPEKYQSHFSEYIKKGIEADNMEELYKKVHAAIRADPTLKKSEKKPPREHKR